MKEIVFFSGRKFTGIWGTTQEVADAHHQVVAEEEVHGQVHLGIQPDQQDDELAGQLIGSPLQDKKSSLCLAATGEPP